MAIGHWESVGLITCMRVLWRSEKAGQRKSHRSALAPTIIQESVQLRFIVPLKPPFQDFPRIIDVTEVLRGIIPLQQSLLDDGLAILRISFIQSITYTSTSESNQTLLNSRTLLHQPTSRRNSKSLTAAPIATSSDKQCATASIRRQPQRRY